MTGTNVGGVYFDLSVNNSGFTKSIQQNANSAQSTMSKAMSSIGKAIASAFAIKAITNFGQSCITAATEMNSAFMGLQSILSAQGKSFAAAQDFINDYVEDGLIPATDAITAYKNLASRGYDDTQIQSTLTSLKDAAAFGRASAYSYGEAIRSATEGLKNENSVLVDNAGVTKNVAKMWEEYAAKIGVSSTALTQNQKIQAEVAGIQAETAYQTGDAARYAGTYAGSVARLTAQFLTLKQALGNLIIPIANAILPYIQKAISWFQTLANTISKVFGVNLSGTASTATSAIENYTTSTNAATAATNNLAKASKKAVGVQGFDNVNNLGKSGEDTEVSSVSVPSGTEISQDGALPLIVTPVLENSGETFKGLEKVFEFIKKNIKDIEALAIGFLGGVLLVKYLPKILELVEAISVFGLKDGVKYFVGGEAGAAKFTAALKNLAAQALIIGGTMIAALGISKIVEGFKEGDAATVAIGIALLALGAIAITAGTMINAGIKKATAGLIIIIEAIVVLIALLAALVACWVTQKDSIMSVEESEKALAEAKQATIDATKAQTDALNTNLNAIDAAEQAEKDLAEAEKRTGLSGAALEAQVKSGTLSYQNMTAEQREVYRAYVDNIQKQDAMTASQAELEQATLDLTAAKKAEQMASFENQLALAAEKGNYDEYKASVVDAFNKGEVSAEEARDLIEQSMSRMSDAGRKTFMEDLPSDISNGMDPSKYQTSWQKFSNWCSNVWNGLVDGIKNIWNGIANFFTKTIPSWFTSAKDKIVDIWNSIVDFIKKPINFVISGINKIAFDVPDWVPLIGGKHFGFNIPMLAQGGIVSQPTLAMVGERGREAVMPLENNTGWIDQLAATIYNVMSASGGTMTQQQQQTSANVTLNIDGKEIARALNAPLEYERNKSGIAARLAIV